MLPYSLKVVWFALSLAGLLSSWATLPLFPSQLHLSGWIPLVYGATDTALQAVFCLGLVWKMDPFLMPHAFCIAQTVLIHVAWAALSGLCASITLSTAAVVFSSCPRFFRMATRLPVTITLIIIFPTIVLVLQLALVLKLDAALPANGMNCDATNPTWVRLFGYAGLTLLLSVPSFILSLMTAMRLFFKPPHPPLQKSRPVSHVLHSQASLTPVPQRRPRIRETKPQSSILESQIVTEGHTSPYLAPSPLLLHKNLPDSPGRAPVLAKHSKFHLPFDAPPSPTFPHSRCSSTLSHVPSLLRESPVSVLAQAQAQGEAETEDAPLPPPRIHPRPHSQSLSQSHSPSPIIFASPSRDGSQNNTVVIHVAPSVTEIVLGVPVAEDEDDVLSEEDVVEEPLSLWAGKPDRLSIAKDSLMYGAADDDERSLYGLSPYPRIRRLASGEPPWLDEPAEPEPCLVRTAMFQLFVSSTLVLAAITSLIDILTPGHHAPAPLGTQHVALLLAAWGPCLFVLTALLPRLCSRVHS